MKFIALAAIFTLVVTETFTGSIAKDVPKVNETTPPHNDQTPVDAPFQPGDSSSTDTPKTTPVITTPTPNTTTFAPNTTTTTVAPNTTTTTLAPNTTTTTLAPNTTTTTLAPNTTTVSPTTLKPTTVHPPVPTTVEPAHHTDRKFDTFSFVAGIVMSAGLLAIGLVAFKFYEARRDRNYHTI